MDMQTLSNVASICFRVSIVIFVIGAVLTALTFWKLNIREVYLIRSGKARRRTIIELEEHNRETGKLRDNIDLDYTTGSLKKTSKRLGRTSETAEHEPHFTKGTHSGNTGAFSTPIPSQAQQRTPEQPGTEASAAQVQQSAATALEQLDSGETVPLESYIPATSGNYASRINTAYQEIETGDLGGAARPAPTELTVPVNIISCELIIHTNEIIEI